MLKAKNLTTSSHNATLSLFGFHFIKPGLMPPAYGKMLNNAFAMRQQGDYDYDIEIEATVAGDILENAKDFVQVMEDWLKNNNYL